MSDKERLPFGQTTAGVLMIQGLLAPAVGAIVSVIVTLNQQPQTFGDVVRPKWWEIALIAAAVAAVVFVVFSLIAGRLRRIVWGWVPRVVRWIVGLRLTTRRKRDELVELGYLRRSAEQTIKDLEVRAAADKSSAQVQEFIQGALEKTKIPALPPPYPRLKLERQPESASRYWAFGLVNLMSGSVMRNARVDVLPKSRFVHDDQAFWQELEPTVEVFFEGNTTWAGANRGFTVRLTWFDQDAKPHDEEWEMGRTESPPDF